MVFGLSGAFRCRYLLSPDGAITQVERLPFHRVGKGKQT